MYQVYSRKVYATLWDINSGKTPPIVNGFTVRTVIIWLYINKRLLNSLYVSIVNKKYLKTK